MIDEGKEKLLLAVWNLSDEGQKVTLDLRKYGMQVCDRLYPQKKQGVVDRYENGKLEIDFSSGKTARLFLLTK